MVILDDTLEQRTEFYFWILIKLLFQM